MNSNSNQDPPNSRDELVNSANVSSDSTDAPGDNLMASLLRPLLPQENLRSEMSSAPVSAAAAPSSSELNPFDENDFDSLKPESCSSERNNSSPGKASSGEM
jgi:hypothetical protein